MLCASIVGVVQLGQTCQNIALHSQQVCWHNGHEAIVNADEEHLLQCSWQLMP